MGLYRRLFSRAHKRITPPPNTGGCCRNSRDAAVKMSRSKVRVYCCKHTFADAHVHFATKKKKSPVISAISILLLKSRLELLTSLVAAVTAPRLLMQNESTLSMQSLLLFFSLQICTPFLQMQKLLSLQSAHFPLQRNLQMHTRTWKPHRYFQMQVSKCGNDCQQ